MATFKIDFRLSNSLEGSLVVSGAKIPKATLKKWYGSAEDKEIYRLHNNIYGIVWLIKEKTSWGEWSWSLSDDPSKATHRIPRYTRLVVRPF